MNASKIIQNIMNTKKQHTSMYVTPESRSKILEAAKEISEYTGMNYTMSDIVVIMLRHYSDVKKRDGIQGIIKIMYESN